MQLRNFLLFLLFFAAVLPLRAQFQPVQLKENQKQWEDGKLTWDDFRGVPLLQSFIVSEFAYSLQCVPDKIRWNDTMVYRLKAVSVIEKDQSWVLYNAKTEPQLNYNQLLFNVLELHERVLQQKLNRLKAIHHGPAVLDQTLSQLQADLELLAEETGSGRSEEVVKERLRYSESLLDSVKTEVLPPFRASNFGLGMHWGMSYAVAGGGLKDRLSGHTGIAMGFDYRYKKAMLYFDLVLGFGKMEGSIAEKPDWPAGQKTNIALPTLGIGYAVLDNARWRFTPFVGGSAVEISPRQKTDVPYKDNRLVAYNLSYGLNLDWKLRHQVNLLPLGFGREVADLGMRARFVYYPVSLGPSLNGSVYNFTLAFYGNAHFVRFR